MPQYSHAVPITFFFGVWMLALHVVTLAYQTLIFVHRDTFDVRIRLPSLTIAEVVVIQLCTCTVALREIFVSWGWSFPHEAQNASFVGVMLNTNVFVPLRCLQLIVIFDPIVRKAYHQHFNVFKTLYLLCLFIISALLFLILEICPFKGCLRR